MIAITTMDSLPELCYECPCHEGENGQCNADKEKRYSFEYRPYWCPLKDVDPNNVLKKKPREITKEEWESWKKEKHRDPLCMYWHGDVTPFWILKPEDVHEPAYLIGDIKIFKGKPDKEKMYKIWEQDRGK